MKVGEGECILALLSLIKDFNHTFLDQRLDKNGGSSSGVPFIFS
jgi:hypothetical protein